jgi:hypothetical protein
VLERVRRHVHHDLAEHLDEPAVGVPSESDVAIRLLREPLDGAVVQAKVQDGVHHPGHRELRPRPHRDQQRVVRITERLAHRVLETAKVLPRLLEHLGRSTPLREERQARLGGDRESGRDRQAHVGHLGEVGPLAAEEVLHLLVAFGEVVDVLGHSDASAAR